MQSKQYFTKIKNYPHEKSTEPEYRNKWIHISEQKDCNIQIDYVELEEMALFAYRLTLEVFHYYPFI